MRTTVDIDERALRDAGSLLGETSVTRIVNHALRELVRLRRIEEMRGWRGRGDLVGDWREMEELEMREVPESSAAPS